MADIVTNSQARRDYHILEVVEAGIVLRGTEVKSLRAGKGQIRDAYAEVRDEEAWLHNAHIDEYLQGNRENHLPKSRRKLLLHKSEIRRLGALAAVKGNSLIPLSLYWKQSKVKVAIAVAQGKATYDKRETLKREEAEKEMKRAASASIRRG